MTAFVRRWTALSFWACTLLFCCVPLKADRPGDIRAQFTYVASALADANPSDALGPFDKSFKDYGKLVDYFDALTKAFEVASEIEIKDEDDDGAETKLVLTWNLTLTELVSGATSRRTADVSLTFAQRSGKWKIVDLSPIELFNPQQTRP